MSESTFQPPNGDSEAQEALKKENRLPLTGWQQEVDRGLELGQSNIGWCFNLPLIKHLSCGFCPGIYETGALSLFFLLKQPKHYQHC